MRVSTLGSDMGWDVLVFNAKIWGSDDEVGIPMTKIRFLQLCLYTAI